MGFGEKLSKFIKLVNKGSKYDLKSQPEYVNELRCIYNGLIMRLDGSGNITYGFFGAALKIHFLLLMGGGGAAQINDNLLGGTISPSEVAKGNLKSLKNIKKDVIITSIIKDKYNPAWFLTFGDDPYDQQWVAYGYGLYKHNKV